MNELHQGGMRDDLGEKRNQTIYKGNREDDICLLKISQLRISWVVIQAIKSVLFYEMREKGELSKECLLL